MSRTKDAPWAADYAVLGLLRDALAHGYVIAQRFVPGQDLGLFCPMDQSSVYTLLHDLQRQGLIAGKQEAAGARPPRTVFHLTPKGEEVLTAWLNEPCEPLRRLRLDFLLKLFFLRGRDHAAASALLRRQLEVCEQYAQHLQEESAALPADGFERMIVESKRAALAGVVDFVRRERATLADLAGAGVS